MAPLTAADVLRAWERAAGRPPGEQALALAAACSGLTPGEAGELTVGDRDRRLIAAYRGLVGRRITGRADCLACGELLELDLDLAEFDRPAAAAVPFAAGGCEVEWRLPTAADVAGVERARSPDELLRRCLVRLAGDLPPDLAERVAEAVAAADPLTDVRLRLGCVGCGHEWEVGFDPVAFLWAEVDALARRLLGEVHALAAAYGWHEADILAMSAARRAAYLRMSG